MEKLKNLIKSKTFWFAMILAVLSVVQGYLGLFNLEPQDQMYVGVAISVIVTILRFVTTTSLENK